MRLRFSKIDQWVPKAYGQWFHAGRGLMDLAAIMDFLKAKLKTP